MTSPLSPEAVAQMVAELRASNHLVMRPVSNGAAWGAADMLTTLAAENATLRADYEDAFVRGMAHGQNAMPKGTFTVVDSPEIATLRASEAAAQERVKVLEAAMVDGVELAHGISFTKDNKLIADWGFRVERTLRKALTPTADKEPKT